MGAPGRLARRSREQDESGEAAEAGQEGGQGVSRRHGAALKQKGHPDYARVSFE